MKMRRGLPFILSLLMLLMSGCQVASSDIIGKDVAANTSKIVIAINYDDYYETNEAKIIEDPKEVEMFVAAFRSTKIIEPTENIYGSTSVFLFFKDDTLLTQVKLCKVKPPAYVRPTEGIWTFHSIKLLGDNPWTLYDDSTARTCFIDKDFNLIP